MNIESMANNPYFSNTDLDYVYKADITVYGNEFSGILIIKKIETKKHRLVFTSQFGNTFFDIEFDDGSHEIKSIVKQLNKKIILNTLIRDFSLLVKENQTVSEKYNNETYNVLKNRKDKRSNYYFYNKINTNLYQIVHTTKRKEKFIIRFNDILGDQIVENINIDHQNIKLKIELNLLKK